MKTQIFLLLSFSLFLSTKIGHAQGLKMQVELDDPAQLYSFVQPQSVFLSEGEKFSLFDLKSGKKTYEVKIEDYEKKGPLKIIENKLFVSSDKKLNCYDVLSGSLLWAKEYNDIDQEEFNRITKVGTTLLLRYNNQLVAAGFNNGNELWRQNVAFAGKDFYILNAQKKFAIPLVGYKFGVYDFDTGKQLFEGKDFDWNSKLIQKGYPWMSLTKDEHYGLFLLDEYVAVMDFTANELCAKVKISYDSDFPPVLPLSKGSLILGSKKLVYMNDLNGGLTEIPASVGDFRTYDVMTVGTKEILVAGLKNSMLAVDLAGGKILWQSKEDDPIFEGYAHQYLKVEGSSIIFTYNNTGFSIGTDLFLMSVDAFTGKLNYKVPVANCKQAIMGFQRMMAKTSSKIDGTKNDVGYNNIGFNYSYFEKDGNLIIAIVSPYGMRTPEKRTDGGEGICIVDPKTGKILFSDYVELSEETSSQRKPGDYWVRPPFIDNDNIILLGDRSGAVWDLHAMKRLWYNQKCFKSGPMDVVVMDNVLYLKYGERAMSVNLSKEGGGLFSNYGMSVEESWSEEPFGFAAYDVNTGKMLWNVETLEDPGFLSRKFSLKNDFEPASKHIYFADEDNLYALQLNPGGGRYDWTYKYDANGMGNIPLKECYATKEFEIGEVNVGYSTIGTDLYRSEKTSLGGAEYNYFQEEIADAYDYLTYTSGYTVWGVAAKKCLGFIPDGKDILLVTKKAIALVDEASGKTVWKNEWSYDQDNVEFLPKVLEDKLVYCVDRQLKSVSMTDGRLRFQAKESSKPHFILSPDKKYMISIDEDGKVIKGYEL